MTQLRQFPCCCGGLRWLVTPEFCGSGITKGFCRGITGFVGDAVWPRATVGGVPSVRLVDAVVEMAYETWPPTSLCVHQRRT